MTTAFQDVRDARIELNLFAHALNNTIPLMQLSARCLSDQRQTEYIAVSVIAWHFGIFFLGQGYAFMCNCDWLTCDKFGIELSSFRRQISLLQSSANFH